MCFPEKGVMFLHLYCTKCEKKLSELSLSPEGTYSGVGLTSNTLGPVISKSGNRGRGHKSLKEFVTEI